MVPRVHALNNEETCALLFPTGLVLIRFRANAFERNLRAGTGTKKKCENRCMVGKLRISPRADAVRHLFMEFEKHGKKLRPCPFCGAAWPTLRLANRGHLTGNHELSCPFEQIAEAVEKCIILRDEDDAHAKAVAEENLGSKIASLLSGLTKEVMPECLFPVCQYSHDLGHRLECPLRRFQHEVA